MKGKCDKHGDRCCRKCHPEISECCRGKKGKKGKHGSTGPTGPTGLPGTAVNTGATGSTGPAGPINPGGSGLPGAAQFIRTLQSPNNSIPPNTAFTIDTTVANSVGSGITAVAGNGGTVFQLTNPGLYQINYETSLEASGSLAVSTGPVTGGFGGMAQDVNSIAGAATGTTWIHGKFMLDITVPTYVMLTSHTGTANTVNAGNSSPASYVVRFSIEQLM